jgi:tRNA-dihydrouridine synthase
MVNARAVVENNPRALKLMEFAAEEMLGAGGARERIPENERWRAPGRVLQLFSNNVEDLARATEVVCEGGLADGIDLNFGCPVPKVTRKGGGSAIPWKGELLTEMLTKTRRITADFGVTLSAKFRIGIDDQHSTFEHALRISESLGLDFVTLHARTAAQFYGGSADWSAFIRAIEVTESLPIFLNGDLFSGADTLNLLTALGVISPNNSDTTQLSTQVAVPNSASSTSLEPHLKFPNSSSHSSQHTSSPKSTITSAGPPHTSPSSAPPLSSLLSPFTSPGSPRVSPAFYHQSLLNRVGLASARGTLGRPWLFAEIRQSLGQGSAVKIDKSVSEIVEIAQSHLESLVRYFGNEPLAVKSFRKHTGYYFKGFNVGSEMRRKLSGINSVKEFATLCTQLTHQNPQLQTSETLKRSKTGFQRRVHLPEGWLETQ